MGSRPLVLLIQPHREESGEQKSLGDLWSLGGDPAGGAAPACPTPHSVMTWWLLLRGWLHISCLVVRECFHLHHLSFLGWILLVLFFIFALQFTTIILFQLFRCSYFNPGVFLLLPYCFTLPLNLLWIYWKAAVWCLNSGWVKTWHGFTGLQWLVKLMLWFLPALLRQDSHKWCRSAGSNNTLWFVPSYGENDFISSSETKGNDSSKFCD